MLRSFIARLVLVVSFTGAKLVALFSRYFLPNSKRASSGCIVVTGTFHNPNWFLSHLLPLANCGLREVIVVADEPHQNIDGIRYFCPPIIVQKLLSRAFAKLVWLVIAGIRFHPDLYMGYHIFPNGLNALIAGKLFRRAACYQMCGGPVEILGGGIDCENRLMSCLDSPLKLLERLGISVLREFDQIVVRGNSAKKFVADLGLVERVTIIPGSVQVLPESVDTERKYDIVFVGRLEEIKQPLQVVEVMSLVQQQVPSVRGAIIGAGPLQDEMRRVAKDRGIEGQLEFLGKRKDVEALLAQSKIFILTSRSEGLSIAMAEAMAAGVVPVVADVGDLSDLISSDLNGYLIEPNNIAQYAEVIVTLLKNKQLLLDFSQSAKEAARNYNSIAVVSQRWASCINEMVK